MGHKASITALRKYTNVTTLDVSTNEMIQSLVDESDRGLIILAVTMIDDSLLAALTKRVEHLTSDEKKSLFDIENGILSSFSKRLRLAYAFRYLDKETYEIVDLFRHLRNCAAHARNPVSFDTQVIRQAIAAITQPDAQAHMLSANPILIRNFFSLLCGTLADKIEGLSLTPESGNIRTMMQAALALAKVHFPEHGEKDSGDDHS